MLKISPEAIEALPEDERAKAKELLAQYETSLKQNPMRGYEPHPKQHVFHSSDVRLKAFLGGNRSGKTTAGILDDLIQAVDAESLPDHLQPYKKWQPPFYCRIIVPDFTSTMEGVIFQKLREWIPRDQLAGGAFDKAYEKTLRKLRFKNGSWFDFMTFEQDLDKFGGAALHRVHYDEEPPLQIRKESRMRLIDYGGDELFTMTPLQGMSWMFDQIWEPWTKHQLKNSLVVTVDMDDNPHLNEQSKIEVLEGLSHEERQARKSGRFVHFAGMIYGEFSRSTHVIPEPELPENAKVIVGIDPGMRHMAAVLWVYLDEQDNMVCFDELALQGHTVAQVCDAIHLINEKHAFETPNGRQPLKPWQYVIDPAARNIMHQTGKSDQMEFSDHGVVTILGQNSVTAGINRVKERLQGEPPTLYIGANCTTLIDQFRKYRWQTPKRIENDAKEAPVKTDDHMLDALRYIVASRPARPHERGDEKYLSPMEKAIKRDMQPRKRKYIPKTAHGGIFQ